jgi:L-gulono-1,4-lactone dehydrogenase
VPKRRLPTPRDRTGRFVNWAKTQSSAPVRWDAPCSEADVVALVRRARADGRRLRTVGAGHSWSQINLPEDCAVTLDDVGTAPRLDSAAETVTVSGGMRLRDLSAFLMARGLSLPIVGSIQAQSVAGAIATGTHGSSLVHGNLAGLVTSMRVVTGTGDVVAFDPGDPRFDGVRVHLGALGIVTEVTLRVQASRRLHQRIEQLPIADVPDALAGIATSAEYVKVWWLPHAPTAQVIRYVATDEPATRRPTAVTQRRLDEQVMHRALFPAFVALHHRRPAMVAGWNSRMSRTYLGRASQIGADALMLNTPMPMRHRETEAALPLASAGDALRDLLGIFHDGRPAANFPLEIRFVRGDEVWMSPAYGADTCQIGAYTTIGPDCDSYFSAFWDVMNGYEARPHWGKELDHDAAALHSRYPRFDHFVALRDELDPDGVFRGEFHDRILGDRVRPR